MFQKVWRVILKFVRKLTDEQVSVYAAQSAFFIILSFIPFLILLTSLVRHIPGIQRVAAEAIVSGIPTKMQYLIKGIINEVYGRSGVVLPVTIVVALWSSGKGFQALTNGLNAIYNVKETRNFLYMRIRSIIYTILFVIAITLTLLLLVFGRSIQKTLVLYWPFVAGITDFILKFSSLIAMCILAFAFLIFYTFLPNKKRKLKNQLPGALVTTVLWTAFSFCFSLYFEYFPSITNMYGSLTAIMLIMIWLYVCMFFFLMGAEINQILEEDNL